MSESRYYTPPGSNIKIPYTPPRDTTGMLTNTPKLEPFRPMPGSIRPLLQNNGMSISSMAAAHAGVFRNNVQRFIPPQAVIERRLRAQLRERQCQLLFQGEANRVLPDRGSFSADPSSKPKKREVRANEGYRRGDVVVHLAAHKRLTIMGPSRSKPGFLKAVAHDGEVYRVSPRNIAKM